MCYIPVYISLENMVYQDTATAIHKTAYTEKVQKILKQNDE